MMTHRTIGWMAGLIVLLAAPGTAGQVSSGTVLPDAGPGSEGIPGHAGRPAPSPHTADAAARMKALIQMATIVRRRIPTLPPSHNP